MNIKLVIINLIFLISCQTVNDSSAEEVALPKEFSGLIKFNKKPYFASDDPTICSPGSSPREKTHGPHVFGRMNIYLNSIAYKCLQEERKFEPGSIILKHKIDSKVIGAMIKKEPGYDKDNGDWYYFTSFFYIVNRIYGFFSFFLTVLVSVEFCFSVFSFT